MDESMQNQEHVAVEETQTVYVLGELNELSKTYDLKKTRLEDMQSWFTTVEPPLYSDNTIPVFDKDTLTWSVVEDNRGLIEYSSTTQEAYYIDYLGAVRESFSLDSPNTIASDYLVSYR